MFNYRKTKHLKIQKTLQCKFKKYKNKRKLFDHFKYKQYIILLYIDIIISLLKSIKTLVIRLL